MPRSKSSHRWLREHFEDEYVDRAQKEGYRSRAVYKLKEIHEKDHLLKTGMTVVDLGAAPGSWSQFAVQQTGEKGLVVALDILPMSPLPGVVFIQGDFREQALLEQLLATVNGRSVNLVLSDMAPNISGVKAVDQPHSMYLAELAFDLAKRCLAPGGGFLVKTFQGEGFDHLLREMRCYFATVAIRKPKSSRARSPEVYLLARNYGL